MFVCLFVCLSVRSCARPHFSRRVRIVWLYSLWISVMYVLIIIGNNILAEFIAPCDGCIVCGNR